MNKLLLALSLTLLPMLAHAADAPAKFFSDRDRTYQHDLFPSQAACDEARRRFPILNCAQWATFRTDGSAMLVLTDIANIAKYEIAGNQVRLTVESAGEISGTLVFTSDDGFQTLKLQSNGTVWKLRPAAGE